MLIERMNKNFTKHFSPFFFIKVLAMVQNKKEKRKGRKGFNLDFYYHNRVVLNESSICWRIKRLIMVKDRKGRILFPLIKIIIILSSLFKGIRYN
jgi:hypothetical protein